MARSVLVVLLFTALIAARPVLGQPPPPGAPPPPDAGIAVPRHVRAVSEHLAAAAVGDDVGRRALAEARTSLSAAQSALAAQSLRTADELAASADDLVHAANGPPKPGPLPDPAEVLARIAVVQSALSSVPEPRVRELLSFANDVADRARRKAAASDLGAGREAARAEAIARAAAHVAIAADPSLGPVLPPPRPPKPPKGLSE